ncbi:MAG: SAF domain-containing protein [Candidatus Promineifilaceae bacterium]
MRSRTILLLVLVLIVAALAALFIFVLGPSDGPLAGILGRGQPTQPQDQADGQEQGPGTPQPSRTPAVELRPVVVAQADLPAGELIRPELIAIEQRPETNVAVVAGVTFSELEEVSGQITKTRIERGQEILRPMLALNPSDIASLGSDLSLYVDQGEVAVAFPINTFSGAAFALRPGDLVDALMSLTLVQLDQEFQTVRPNMIERVFEPDLLAGRAFLFPPTSEGRLELIPLINSVGVIGPGGERPQVPRRVTQLTIQQIEVLWVGSWRNPNTGLSQEFNADAVSSAATPTPAPQADGAAAAPPPTPTRQRPEVTPDVVILSLSAQDALALKWALDTGIDIDLALRAQGDSTVFATTSVSLPQLVEQGILAQPQPGEFGLEPRVDEVPTPGLPANPPN